MRLRPVETRMREMQYELRLFEGVSLKSQQEI